MVFFVYWCWDWGLEIFGKDGWGNNGEMLVEVRLFWFGIIDLYEFCRMDCFVDNKEEVCFSVYLEGG